MSSSAGSERTAATQTDYGDLQGFQSWRTRNSSMVKRGPSARRETCILYFAEHSQNAVQRRDVTLARVGTLSTASRYLVWGCGRIPDPCHHPDAPTHSGLCTNKASVLCSPHDQDKHRFGAAREAYEINRKCSQDSAWSNPTGNVGMFAKPKHGILWKKATSAKRTKTCELSKFTAT